MRTNWTSQAGNALVETTGVLAVMLPLIFAISWLGNLLDLKQTTVQAVRYSSWDTTVRPNLALDTEFETKISGRFFGVAEAPIQSNDLPSSSNRLWGSATAPRGSEYQDTAIVADPNSLKVIHEDVDTASSAALQTVEHIGGAGKALKSLSGNEWGLTQNGLQTSTVSLDVHSGWFRELSPSCADDVSAGCIVSHAVILNDSWIASGSDAAERRVRSLMPASALEPVGDAISVLGNIPLFDELKDLKGAFGHVDVNALPRYLSP